MATTNPQTAGQSTQQSLYEYLTNGNVQPAQQTPQGLGDLALYKGTINGIPTTVRQGQLGSLDAGSVNMAQVGGNLYGGDTVTPQNSGGLGNYGTYNGVGVSKDAFNAMKGTNHGGTLTQNPPKPNNTVDNTLGYVNAGIGLGSLAANIYYAEQNKRAQEDATRYARSRDAMADAKTDKFQRNMLHGS